MTPDEHKTLPEIYISLKYLQNKRKNKGRKRERKPSKELEIPTEEQLVVLEVR